MTHYTVLRVALTSRHAAHMHTRTKSPRRKAALRNGDVRLSVCLSVCLSLFVCLSPRPRSGSPHVAERMLPRVSHVSYPVKTLPPGESYASGALRLQRPRTQRPPPTVSEMFFLREKNPLHQKNSLPVNFMRAASININPPFAYK